MENKNYKTIVKLVKNHRKYPGLEAILDDIVADVQERSKVVASTIVDEDILNTYLAKIVSLSIVSVPKKMNFNRTYTHRVITTNKTLETEDLADLTHKKVSEEASTTDSTKACNEHIQNTISEEINIGLQETYNDILPNSLTENLINENLSEYIEPAVTETTTDSTINFVDKMINSVASDEINQRNLVENLNTEDELLELEEPVETEEQVNEEITEDLIEEDELLELEEPVETEEQVNEEITENLIEEEDELLELEEPAEGIEQEEFVDDIEEDTNLLVINDDLISLEDNNNENATDLSLETTEELLEDEESSSSLVSDFTAFKVEYKDFSFDKKEIESLLHELDNKNKNSLVLKIATLKYKHNLTIREIASQLNKDISFVLGTLNDIIMSVKD